MNKNDRSHLQQWFAQASIITLICVSVTVPAITITQALPFFKVEQLLLPLIFLIYGWLLLAGVVRRVGWNAMLLVGLMYCICNAISIWYGAELLGHPVILRDFYELPKVWLPVAFFIVAYEAELSEVALRRLIRVFSFSILGVCLYAWAQFAGISFTYKLNPYYSSGGHIDQALQYAGRVYATMGNPNVLGQLMTWCVVLFVLATLYRVGSSLWNILIASACLITLAMTGSRFGLLTVCVGVLLILGIVSSSRRRGMLQISLLLVLVPLFAFAYQTVASSNRRTLERYQTLRDPLNIDSLRQRVDDLWRDQWDDFTKSPFLGHGPAKALDRLGYSDSEYLAGLKEKGILGLAVFLGYYLYPLYRLRKGQRAAFALANTLIESAPATVLSVHFGLIIGLLALITNIPMATFYTPFLQAFLWLWLGVGARSAATAQQLNSVTFLNLKHQKDFSKVPKLVHLGTTWEQNPPNIMQNRTLGHRKRLDESTTC